MISTRLCLRSGVLMGLLFPISIRPVKTCLRQQTPREGKFLIVHGSVQARAFVPLHLDQRETSLFLPFGGFSLIGKQKPNNKQNSSK